MIQCISCDFFSPSKIETCPECGHVIEIIDDFFIFSPESAREGSGFKSSYFVELASHEAKNFWFRVRNKFILWALKRYSPKIENFLEIGCGTGFVLSGIAEKYPNAQLHGSELFIEGLSFARERLPRVSLMQMDARRIPFKNEFDVIGAFDVIEHIKEDKDVLTQVYRALKPQGIFVITVPQHSWLWSPVDDYACHVRRYSAKELHNKLDDAGFRILRSSSFVTTLLPAMYLSRILQRLSKKTTEPDAGLQIHPVLNYLFEKFLMFELFLVRCGINFPIGGSRLIVAQKRS